MDERFLRRRLEAAEAAWVEAKRTGVDYHLRKRQLRKARRAWREVRPVTGVQPDPINMKVSN